MLIAVVVINEEKALGIFKRSHGFIPEHVDQLQDVVAQLKSTAERNKVGPAEL